MTYYFLESGFIDVVKKSNDPINAVWIGRKPIFDNGDSYGVVWGC